MEFGSGFQNIELSIWIPKTLGSIFGGQQGNSGMDPPILKVRECPPPWETIDANRVYNNHGLSLMNDFSLLQTSNQSIFRSIDDSRLLLG